MRKTLNKKYVSTTNGCKLCKPLGASLAFRGIEGAVPYLHGSQGCATYMRRYIISHFNEPIDIASSSLGEKHAVFGGNANLKQGLMNVIVKYNPRLVGIATTCLTETIGDDVPMILQEFQREAEGDELPLLVHVSTPSYSGTHMEGFHAALRSVVEQITQKPGLRGSGVNLLPGFISPADYRYLKEIMEDFEIEATVLPDISETLDGVALREYPLIPSGGTSIEDISKMGQSKTSIEFGRTLQGINTAGQYLFSEYGVPLMSLGMPMGICETDSFLSVLTELTGKSLPVKYKKERGRLVDAYVDGHKYVSGKRAVIYGEEDLVVGMAALLAEFGIKPVLCASGGKSGRLAESICKVTSSFLSEQPEVRENVDFFEIAEEAQSSRPDLLVGHSKGYQLARRLNIPLVRLGFPIHDRIGGQRILHLGYRGAQYIFDLIVNTLIEKKQDGSSVGYSYM